MPSDRPDSGDTRARLVQAAAALIAEDGWTAATSRAVAARAAANNALVHYHFGTIEGLRRAALRQVLERELLDAVQVITAAPDTLSGLLETIRQLTSGQELTTAQGYRVLAEALNRAVRDEAVRRDLATGLTEFRAGLTARLTEEQRAGRVRADLPAHTVSVLLTALIDGLLLHAMADPALDVLAPTEALTALLRSPNRPSPS